MICGSGTRALLTALPVALLLGACMQMLGYPPPGSTAPTAMASAPPPAPGQMSAAPQPMPSAASNGMDGNWRSSDGVFVATFQNGAFTSRFIQTNEVLAQGSYTVTGDSISLKWVSVATQQERSARCTMSAADSVTCNQDGGGTFDLKRG